MNDRASIRLLFCAIFFCLLLVALAALRACAGQQIEFAETALAPLEAHDDRLLDLDRPLYRCGEVVRVNGQLAIIWDYRFDGREWRYTVRKARYLEK